MHYINMSATIDATGDYRYRLDRSWDEDKPKLCYIMLNPSTADGHVDDATIRKCVGFAKRWGYGSIVVVNLFAYRATNPAEITHYYNNPIGPANDGFILQAVKESAATIAAWGVHGTFKGRDKHVIKLLHDHRKTVYCLGTTKDGYPKHPLYVPYDNGPEIFAVPERGRG